MTTAQYCRMVLMQAIETGGDLHVRENSHNTNLCEVQTQIPFLPKEKMLSIIAEHTTAGHIKEWAYILHDKDIKEDGTPKEPHWHIELRLTRGRRLTDIASWFGLPTMCIQTSKSRRYEPMLQYLFMKIFRININMLKVK